MSGVIPESEGVYSSHLDWVVSGFTPLIRGHSNHMEVVGIISIVGK